MMLYTNKYHTIYHTKAPGVQCYGGLILVINAEKEPLRKAQGIPLKNALEAVLFRAVK